MIRLSILFILVAAFFSGCTNQENTSKEEVVTPIEATIVLKEYKINNYETITVIGVPDYNVLCWIYRDGFNAASTGGISCLTYGTDQVNRKME